jgi:hypothetical protein
VDEGTVPVVCEGGGSKYDFESFFEHAGNSADDSRKMSSSRCLILTKADYQSKDIPACRSNWGHLFPFFFLLGKYLAVCAGLDWLRSSCVHPGNC